MLAVVVGAIDKELDPPLDPVVSLAVIIEFRGDVVGQVVRLEYGVTEAKRNNLRTPTILA